jgi:hypothetical protein
MATRIIGTWVHVELSGRLDPPDGVSISVTLLADIEVDGRALRYQSAIATHEIELGRDPTNQLVAAADEMRDLGLGDLIGDIRRDELNVTRPELYTAPFRIELSPAVRDRLSGTWDYRDPRPDAWGSVL